MAGTDLIAQCAMYCQHKGLVPIRVKRDTLEGALMRQAVTDYKHGTFEDLNDYQRRVIAGVE